MSEVDETVEQCGSEWAEPGDGLDVRIAWGLIEQARAEGVWLVGEGGLLQQVTRTVLQTALEAELGEYLGQGRGESPPAGGDNYRNGSCAQTVRREVGDVGLQVPRDRQGWFEPRIVAKHARGVGGFDEAIISLYAKGSDQRGDPRTLGRDLRRAGLRRPGLPGQRHGRPGSWRPGSPGRWTRSTPVVLIDLSGGADRRCLRQDPRGAGH